MQLEQLDLPGGGLLTVYLRDCVETMPLAMERPLVLVVPGGGYSHVSAREGDPVALQFAAAGYHTAVLRYAVGDDAAHGLPLLPAMPQHPGVQGEAHGGSFRPGHLCGSHLPALSGRGRSGPYFSRSSLFMQKLYHCFLSVSTSAQQFLQVCAACSSSASFAAQLRHKPYKTLPSHCSVKPCSAIRWARTSSMKWQSR